MFWSNCFDWKMLRTDAFKSRTRFIQPPPPVQIELERLAHFDFQEIVAEAILSPDHSGLRGAEPGAWPEPEDAQRVPFGIQRQRRLDLSCLELILRFDPGRMKVPVLAAFVAVGMEMNALAIEDKSCWRDPLRSRFTRGHRRVGDPDFSLVRDAEGAESAGRLISGIPADTLGGKNDTRLG